MFEQIHECRERWDEIFIDLDVTQWLFAGFQLRFCRVDAENGILSYFLPPESNEEQVSGIPRGQIALMGALINPSDEDSRTFTINPASGESIKLKASDVRARQEWVDGLRAVVEHLSTQERSPLPPRESLAAFDCLVACRKQLHDTEMCNAKLVQLIEGSQGAFNHNDPDLLLLKALSSSTASTLSVGLTHLQKYQDTLRAEMY